MSNNKDAEVTATGILRLQSDPELNVERSTNWGDSWPTWRIIHAIVQHDAYHTCQIAAFRSMLKPAQ